MTDVTLALECSWTISSECRRYWRYREVSTELAFLPRSGFVQPAAPPGSVMLAPFPQRDAKKPPTLLRAVSW